jgi:hypothetical protein
MKNELLSAPYLHCDETWFQVMGEEDRSGTSKSHMRVMTGGSGKNRVALYRYHVTREADSISKFLATHSGFLHPERLNAVC